MSLPTNTEEIQVLGTALKVVTSALDSLISACTSEDGSLKAPSKEEVIKAKKLLPPSYKNTLIKK